MPDPSNSGSAAFDDTNSDTSAASPHRGRGDAWGIGALALIGAAIACQNPAAPARDPRCVYPGDTVAVLVGSTNGRITQCAWLIAQSKECYPHRVVVQAPRCVLGEPAPHGQRGGAA